MSIDAADALDASGDFGTGGATLTGTDSVVHDVLVVYTPAATSAWGQSTLESMIHSAVQAANQAYRNSAVGVTMNLVGLQRISMSESGAGMLSTLNNLIQNPTVRSLRDQVAADMVVLVSQDADYCGYASLWISNGNADAYSVVNSNCLSGQSLAHEVGHLQQVDHNRENGGTGGTYPYGYGYRVCASDGFRDIMSYQCPSTNVQRILQFSNPNVYYNGYATGISYEASPSTSADSARALNNTATTVANYRIGTVSLPAAPTGLGISSARSDRIALAWSDNSSNEAGFKIQRSRDGVTYSWLATLGANTTTFTDTSVSPSTMYYYRVRAYNSAGGSNFSNTASAKTSAAAPAAPANVAAANGANGTAIVTWTDKSSNETRFDIRRRKWDSVTKTWSPFITVGTVGANVTRYVNKSGKGTFRYHVRAANTYGASSWVGPAQVTVTGG
jgi:hypothetical protein